MTLQTFLIVQLGVLALGLVAAMGWRGWQMRRQMTLLTESMTNPEGSVVSTPPKLAATPVPEEDPEPQTDNTAEEELEEPADEPTEEPTENSAADEDPANTATDAATDSDFDDLDDLLNPDNADPEEPTIETEPTKAAAEPPTLEPEPTPKPPAAAAEPAVEENGLRALVTKFASENRQLLEQVHTLEAEVQRLEAEQSPEPEPEAEADEPLAAESKANTEATNAESETPEPAES